MGLNCGQEELEIEGWHDDEFDAAVERLVYEACEAVDVEEGEHSEDFVLAALVGWADGILDLGQVGYDVAVGEHDAFG